MNKEEIVEALKGKSYVEVQGSQGSFVFFRSSHGWRVKGAWGVLFYDDDEFADLLLEDHEIVFEIN